eukprot:scaffold17729_cov36-Prasinocladus_malaysianus.AAC.2
MATKIAVANVVNRRKFLISGCNSNHQVAVSQTALFESPFLLIDQNRVWSRNLPLIPITTCKFILAQLSASIERDKLSERHA